MVVFKSFRSSTVVVDDEYKLVRIKKIVVSNDYIVYPNSIMTFCEEMVYLSRIEWNFSIFSMIKNIISA